MKNDLLSKDIVQDNIYKLKKSNGDMFIPAISNTMFYTMFNNTKRKKYAAYLLSLVLEKDYNEILNNMKFSKDVLDKERYHNKGETVDLVVNVGDEFYNIEMNNNKSVEFMERNIDYTGRIYGSRAELGGIYQYNTIIQININNFNFEGNKKTICTYQYRDKEGEVLTNKIKIIYIYLPLIKEKYYNKSELNELEKFLLVINEDKKEDIDSFLKEGKIMEEYRRDAEDTSRKSEVVGLYNKEQEDEFLFKAVTTRQYRDGLEQGIEQGIKQNKLEIASKMLEKNMSDDLIMSIINIDKDELEKIKNMVEHN